MSFWWTQKCPSRFCVPEWKRCLPQKETMCMAPFPNLFVTIYANDASVERLQKGPTVRDEFPDITNVNGTSLQRGPFIPPTQGHTWCRGEVSAPVSPSRCCSQLMLWLCLKPLKRWNYVFRWGQFTSAPRTHSCPLPLNVSSNLPQNWTWGFPVGRQEGNISSISKRAGDAFTNLTSSWDISISCIFPFPTVDFLHVLHPWCLAHGWCETSYC